MSLVFFGTPEFASSILEPLINDVVAVVTQPPKSKGRSKKLIPSPVEELARAHEIPIHYDPKEVAEYGAEIFVVAAYGKILRQEILDLPSIACINVHPSQLPKYRGAAPLQHALLNGDSETAVCIMHMVKAMDAGDIILSEEIAIDPNETYGELSVRAIEVANRLLPIAIKDLREGRAERRPQVGEPILAPKITAKDCRIDWSRPATEIHNQIRALSPRPGAWCEVLIRGRSKRLKILRSELSSEGLWLHQGLSILEVQLEGKRAMTTKEFIAGTSPQELILA